MAVSTTSLPPFEDAASARFFEELKGRKLRFPRCPRCKKTFVPPRTRCSSCLGAELEWVDAPARGTLYSFTYQKVGLRFTRPDVIGAVELRFEDGPARLLTRIVGKLDELAIGMPVELDFLEVEPGLVLHQFKPVPEKAKA